MSTLPSFLLVHLDNIAKAERFQSYTLEYEAGSKHGDGFMGEMVAVTLRGLRQSATADGAVADDSLSVICKLLPKSTLRQEQCKRIFTREVHIYRDILPPLRQFQTEKGLTEANGFFAYPHCYVAVADEATNDYVIIMKNLRTHGYSLWDKFTPMPLDTARLLFEQLGRMHGLSLVVRNQRPDLHASIRKLDDNMVPVLINMRQMCESMFKQAHRCLEKAEHKRFMQTVCDTWLEMLTQCANSAAAEPFTVLGHGDCWNNNMMFEGQNNKICLLDWQIARYVSPALDLSYFLFSSTDKAWRDQHFEPLLAVYHQNLCEIGRACGHTAELITMQQLRQQLRDFGKYGVVMAAILQQVMVSDTSDIANFDELVNEQNQPGYDESQEVEVTKFDAVSLAKYRQRVADVLDDAQRMGWI